MEVYKKMGSECDRWKRKYEQQCIQMQLDRKKLEKQISEFESKNDHLAKEIKKWQEKAKKSKLRLEEKEQSGQSERKEKEELMLHKGELEAETSKLKVEIDTLRGVLEGEKGTVASERAEHANERDNLLSKLEELQVSHIRSISSVGTGLEPISDQTFEDKFRALHGKVGYWCRQTFRGKGHFRGLEESDDSDLKIFISTRIGDKNVLSIGKVMEMIIWGYVEKRVLSVWFPAVEPEYLQHMAILDKDIRVGDTSGTSERAEFWRAYTASLLYQNLEVKELLKDVDTITSDLRVLFSKVQADLSSTVESHMNNLREYLHSAMDLAAQLRCQRGVYEVDDSVQLGDPYDDGRMIDLDNPDLKDSEDADHAFVSGIMSKGVVRKKFAGAKEVQEQICKARVLVFVNRPDSLPEGE
ncbi:hypothetical protein BDD12DRAFT_491919 [Trichophaea hybrida]|nr:hypothetical protein BDD12DRAFT_491919 [Trichophaea hybrida]